MEELKAAGWLTLKDIFALHSTNKKSVDALSFGVDWIINSFRATAGKGSSASYSLFRGWDVGYPETTGYIIPTLLNFSSFSSSRQDEILEICLAAGDWLLSMQKTDGSFSGHGTEKSFVFDTGQIIFGMAALYRLTSHTKYKEAIISSANWIIKCQSEGGEWGDQSFDGRAHPYDTRVAWSLLEAFDIVGDERYRSAAVSQLDWALGRISENAWINNLEISAKGESFLHFIAYATEGLLVSGKILSNQSYIDGAAMVINKLYLLSMKDNLKSFYSKNWESTSGSFCLTGISQTAILFKKYFNICDDESFLLEAERLDSFVAKRQVIKTKWSGISGGISGSSPIWGRYMPFKFINWATKFYIDSILVGESITKKENFNKYAG